eukprot:c32134_g1_i1 orf=215-388(+)
MSGSLIKSNKISSTAIWDSLPARSQSRPMTKQEEPGDHHIFQLYCSPRDCCRCAASW